MIPLQPKQLILSVRAWDASKNAARKVNISDDTFLAFVSYYKYIIGDLIKCVYYVAQIIPIVLRIEIAQSILLQNSGVLFKSAQQSHTEICGFYEGWFRKYQYNQQENLSSRKDRNFLKLESNQRNLNNLNIQIPNLDE